MRKKLLSLLGFGAIRLIRLGQEEERRIIYEMMRIDGMLDYLELQKQGAYQLYGQTDDRRFLGIVMYADTLLNKFKKLHEPETKEETNESGGYESSV